MKFYGNALALTLSALIASSCGNPVHKSYGMNGSGYGLAGPGLSSTGSSSSSNVTSGYNCPGGPNVTPSQMTMGGLDAFTVCTGTSENMVLVHGSTQVSNTICLYPAITQGQGPVTLNDPLSGKALVVCQDTSQSTNGVVVSFSQNSNFNALFIVEGPYQSAMSSCLASAAQSGGYSSCPPFSYGQFRQ